MRANLNWPHPPFAVPNAIREDWAAAMARGRTAQTDWQARLAAHPEAAEFNRWHAGDLPEGWKNTALAAAQPGPRPTITASGDTCDALAKVLPETLVLCADLEAPTNHKRSRTAFTADDRSGAYVHCGVREHLMGAMTDGIAAHGGLRPINVTYLAFADYERPAMRMAALMGLPGIFVFSHDSIGVGSNGPTHQPVEILASYRAMPNMVVFRPADAIETAECWQLALERRDGPSMFALSRQDAEQLRFDTSENLSRKGAYVLGDAPDDRDVTLIATGTEVGTAMAAQELLARQGIKAAVVSMPSWELFEEQTPDYQNETLGKAPRIAIEAAMKFGWERWLRPGDAFIGMTGFGASATADVLYDHFGITAQKIAEKAQTLTGS